MSLRSWIVVIVLFAVVSAGITLAVVRASRQTVPPSPELTVQEANEPPPLIIPEVELTWVNDLVAEMTLSTFDAALGDLESCNGHERCLKRAKRLKNWICAVPVCDGSDTSKRPVDCFEAEWDGRSPAELEKINQVICPFMKAPGPETRPALMEALGIPDEPKLVENGAYVLALTVSAKACEEHIKNFLGGYGPQWTQEWYRAMSGCRILARASTSEQEGMDYKAWIKAPWGASACSDMVNPELRSACETPEATSPIPIPYE